MEAMEAAAVAVKVVLVAPAATVTAAGTVSSVLLLDSETAAPPERAGWVVVMVQELVALWPRVVGVQATEDTSTGASRLIEVVCELLLKLAVMVALELEPMEAAALAVKVALVAPAATVTEAGTVSRVLLLESETEAPPDRAGCVVVTVQVLVALWPRLVGMQATDDTSTGASRLKGAVCELLL